MEANEQGNDPNSADYNHVNNDYGNSFQDRSKEKKIQRIKSHEHLAKIRRVWKMYSKQTKTSVEKTFYIHHNDWIERKKEEDCSLQKRIDLPHQQHLCTCGGKSRHGKLQYLLALQCQVF